MIENSSELTLGKSAKQESVDVGNQCCDRPCAMIGQVPAYGQLETISPMVAKTNYIYMYT